MDDNENYNDDEEYEEDEEQEEEQGQNTMPRAPQKRGVSSNPKTKVKAAAKVAKGVGHVAKVAGMAVKQIVLFLVSTPYGWAVLLIIFIIACFWLVISQETAKEVTTNVNKFVNQVEGMDPTTKSLYEDKHSLLLFKVSEVNQMYDFFMNDEDVKGDIKTPMKAIIGLNEVENKKATTGSGSSSGGTFVNTHDISCGATGNITDDELIQLSRVIQSVIGLDKSYEEYLPMAATIVNRLKIEVSVVRKTKKIPGIIDDPTQFPTIETDQFTRADTSTTCTAYKALLNAFNGNDPTEGATFFSRSNDKKWDKKQYEKTYSSKEVSSNKNEYYVYWKKKGQKKIYDGTYIGFKCDTLGNFQPYYQNDPRWTNVKCKDKDMASQACGPTSVAVILTELGLVIDEYDGVTLDILREVSKDVFVSTGQTYTSKKDKMMEPVEIGKMAVDMGQMVDVGISHTFFTQVFHDRFGLEEVTTSSSEQALQYLQQGYIGVASCSNGLFTGGGHIIAIVGHKDGKIQVHNVNSNTGNSGFHDPSILNPGAPGNIQKYFLYKKK